MKLMLDFLDDDGRIVLVTASFFHGTPVVPRAVDDVIYQCAIFGFYNAGQR